MGEKMRLLYLGEKHLGMLPQIGVKRRGTRFCRTDYEKIRPNLSHRLDLSPD